MFILFQVKFSCYMNQKYYVAIYNDFPEIKKKYIYNKKLVEKSELNVTNVKEIFCTAELTCFFVVLS